MNLPKRKPNRLPNYDYSQTGAYFITVCAKEKQMLFGSIVGGGVLDAPQMRLSGYGKIVEQQLLTMAALYKNIRLEKYVVMPNHIHLLLVVEQGLSGASGTPSRSEVFRSATAAQRRLLTRRSPPPTKDRSNEVVPQYVSTLKRFTNRTADTALWQRGYHDHVIRADKDHLMIWQYIDTNPQRWQKDCFYRET